MSDRLRWPKGQIVALLVLALTLPGIGALAHADGRPLYLPLVMKAPTGPLVQVSGRVFLEGRDNHSAAALWIGDKPVAHANADGSFAFTYRLPTSASTSFTLTAQCRSYLWAETVLSTERSLVFALPDVCLLGGDVAGPDSSMVTPAAGCPSSEPVAVAGPADGKVDLYDVTLISANQGKSSGDAQWGPDPCHPEYIARRADVNGDGMVDPQDQALVFRNNGKTAPLPWVGCPR